MSSQIFRLLSSWPDQLSKKLEFSFLDESAKQLRLGNINSSELILLKPGLITSEADSDIVSFLQLMSLLYSGKQISFVCKYPSINWVDSNSIYARISTAQLKLAIGDLDYFDIPGINWSEPPECEFLINSRIAFALTIGNLDLASELLGDNASSDSLEATILRSRLHIALGKYDLACSLLHAATLRAPKSLLLWNCFVDIVFSASDGSRAINVLTDALRMCGEHPLLLSSVSLAKLHSREPGLALRAKLCERLRILSDLPTFAPRDANLISCYDHLGRSDWLQYLSTDLDDIYPPHLDLHSNLMMQLSSVESKSYKHKAHQLINYFTSNKPFQAHIAALPLPLSSNDPHLSSPNSSLKVLWITGDIGNHPVCRFLLGILSACPSKSSHQHVVVSLRSPNIQFMSMFENIPGVSFIDVSSKSAASKTSAIRELAGHIAVDLSGWTGGHHATAFMARVAPVQINYLGYHASTGIPEVDYWLGDCTLFPKPTREWHTEKIWRLPRPFLAWNPPTFLVEATSPITSPPESSGVRFGCFNHFRKVSDSCLSLWAKILDSAPGSRLVLKGTTVFDSSSKELTRRRLERQGLNLDQIDWLPLAPTPAEHLQQYSMVDIALDCFPNTGCTTTCEALWMGVPVVTLAGDSYVSRMSTAVLSAAGLYDWVANSYDEYIQIALSKSQSLHQLRSNRSFWRETLKSSPLGDSEGLFLSLENAFRLMAQEVSTRALLPS
tara:strand:- start:26563 stop:28740 length:2178 start_codon:yes stop_codon:yes gene_type:complete